MSAPIVDAAGAQPSVLDPVLVWRFAEPWVARFRVRFESDVHVVEVTPPTSALSAAARRYPRSVVLIEIADLAAAENSTSLSALCRTVATLRTCAVAAVTTGSMLPNPRVVAKLVRAGVLDVFHVPGSSGLKALLEWVHQRRRVALHERVWTCIASHIPVPAKSLVQSTLRFAHGPIAVSELSRACTCSERTLRRRCERAGVPGPLWLIAMVQLATVAYLIEREGLSFDSAASFLGYDTPRGLRARVVKWTNQTPRALSSSGWLNVITTLLAEPSDRQDH
jgi:AraC-like DNA-binding protein